MTTLDRLSAEKYLLLTTFRKDGRAVPTPVWAVRDGEALAVWTRADSGKVKRIRRSGDVTVAPCDVRGRPHGAAVPAHATLYGGAETRRVRDLLKHKYRLIGRLSLLGSRLRHGEGGTVGIRVTLADGQSG
ncbi:PPOX class F420-dependent oxidoreductase [Micromonospora sp. GCM10011542]|uniref:PPOX class F420-dependent oxidoreductase n=1 Tax=Micromonospora sp. GCM10011542 TaxID=3317337 RepID=UPI00360AEF33